MRAGVRCAETTVSSNGTPNFSRISAASFIVGRSESLPMMIPTSGGTAGSALPLLSLLSALPAEAEEEEETALF